MTILGATIRCWRRYLAQRQCDSALSWLISLSRVSSHATLAARSSPRENPRAALWATLVGRHLHPSSRVSILYCNNLDSSDYYLMLRGHQKTGKAQFRRAQFFVSVTVSLRANNDRDQYLPPLRSLHHTIHHFLYGSCAAIARSVEEKVRLTLPRRHAALEHFPSE